VLEQGVPAEIQLTGSSMEPTLPRGTRVKVSPVDDRTELHAGDILVIATEDPGVLITHRLMHAFVDGGRQLVIHQGDAAGAAFGVVPREHVIARVTGVPTAGGPRFLQRRLAGRAYALAHRLATSTGLRRSPVVRRCSEIFRRLASRVTG
jgi:hypothetical protein